MSAADTLLAVTHAVSSQSNLTDVLEQATRELARALRADVGSVWRLDSGRRHLLPVSFDDAPATFGCAPAHAHVLAAHALSSIVEQSGGPVCSSDSARDPRFVNPLLNRLRHRSVLVQPLQVHGEMLGVFVFIWTRARHRFTDVQLRLVDAVTRQAGLAIEHAHALALVQKSGSQLERRVRDRTARLRRAYTELRASREALRALSSRAEHVRERERARIAREIHDELGQALTALKLDLCRCTPAVDDGADAASLRALPNQVDAMIETVRRISGELRPQVLDDLGLVAAIEWQTREFQTRTGLHCRLRCQGPVGEIDLARSTALFRIFQEILTNVARHAEASRVQITVSVVNRSARLHVRDNGRGMRPDVTGRTRHLGLLGMRERAAEFGGTLHLASAPGRGTTVRVRLPLGQRFETKERAS